MALVSVYTSGVQGRCGWVRRSRASSLGGIEGKEGVFLRKCRKVVKNYRKKSMAPGIQDKGASQRKVEINQKNLLKEMWKYRKWLKRGRQNFLKMNYGKKTLKLWSTTKKKVVRHFWTVMYKYFLRCYRKLMKTFIWGIQNLVGPGPGHQTASARHWSILLLLHFKCLY